MGERVRAHVVLPKEMVEEIDSLVGKRGRSKFIEDALKLKVINERQKRAFAATRGTIDVKDYPEWSTPEKISEWVHNMRQADLKKELEEEARRRERLSQ